MAQQVRRQAEELAAHLRSRQRELDHREAQLNARSAQLDNAARASRLWLSQREEEIQQRQSTLESKEQELRARLDRLAAAEQALHRRQSEWESCSSAREEQFNALAEKLEADRAAMTKAREAFELEQARQRDELARQKRQIDVRREASLALVRQLLEAVQRRKAAIDPEQPASEKSSAAPDKKPEDREQLQDQMLAVELRREQLEKAENELAEARKEVELLRRQLVEERHTIERQARHERQKIAAERRAALAELEQKRQATQRQCEQADRNRAALRKLREELERMHRETLEIRLATEELWVQLSGSAPPAAITHSLAQVRSKLAEHYRMAQAELAEKKREFRSLCERLAKRHQQLRRQKDELERWASARQDEIQQQAQRLVGREQQLEREQQRIDELVRQWRAKELAYLQEIRRLRCQPAHVTSAAVA